MGITTPSLANNIVALKCVAAFSETECCNLRYALLFRTVLHTRLKNYPAFHPLEFDYVIFIVDDVDDAL